MLRCDFNIQKLPIKQSLFNQQVLLYWKMVYSHNFIPHSTPIWNNKYTQHLFFQCNFIDALWTDIHDWLHSNVPLVPFVQNDIIYGVILQNNDFDFFGLIMSSFSYIGANSGWLVPNFLRFTMILFSQLKP